MYSLSKHGDSIRLRCPYTWIGLFLRLVLLGLFFTVTFVFASGSMSWENWLIPAGFICAFLVLSVNKKMAVYKRQTHQLILYRGVFIPKRKIYDLPLSKDQLVFQTEQRIESSNGNGIRKMWPVIDLWMKVSGELIKLDSTPVDHGSEKPMLHDWEYFFAAIYDPEVAKKIGSNYLADSLETVMWILVFLSSGIAFYLNQLSLYLH